MNKAVPHSTPTLDSKRWLALAVLLLAAFMNLIDVTIVNVALPTIQQGLGASYAQAQWVVAGYILTFALGLITGGRIGDIYGHKCMFLLGTAGFTLASVACGIAPNSEMLIGARIFQGLMGAVMVPQVLSIIQVTFPPKEWGTALGMFGAAAGLATVIGPLAGGLLIGADLFGLDWRPIFLVNLPIGLLALIGAVGVVQESRASEGARLDWVGVVIVTGGLLLLVYPLVQGQDLGWPSWSFASLAATVPTLALFGVWERHKAQRDGFPLVTPGLFGQRAFVVGLIITLIFFSGIAGFFMVFAIYLQTGLGFTALQTGLTVAPFSVGVFIASTASAHFAPRFGRRVLSVGALLLAAGMGGMIVIIQQRGPVIGSWELLPALLACGVGMGLVVAPLFDFILAGVHHRDAGAASGVLNTVQQVGNAVGVALIGIMFFGLLTRQTGLVAITPETVEQNFTYAIQGAIWYEVAIFLTCFGLIFLLPQQVHSYNLEQ